jgi:hypothetical protein
VDSADHRLTVGSGGAISPGLNLGRSARRTLATTRCGFMATRTALVPPCLQLNTNWSCSQSMTTLNRRERRIVWSSGRSTTEAVATVRSLSSLAARVTSNQRGLSILNIFRSARSLAISSATASLAAITGRSDCRTFVCSALIDAWRPRNVCSRSRICVNLWERASEDSAGLGQLLITSSMSIVSASSMPG